MPYMRIAHEIPQEEMNHGKMRLHLMRLFIRLFPSMPMHMVTIHSGPLNAKVSANFLLNAAIFNGFSITLRHSTS